MRRKRPSRSRVKLNPVAVWELLDQLGITQKESARRSGISAGYLSQLIRGERSPSPRVQLRLQQVLGVTGLGPAVHLGTRPVSEGRSRQTPLP